MPCFILIYPRKCINIPYSRIIIPFPPLTVLYNYINKILVPVRLMDGWSDIHFVGVIRVE